MLEARCRAPTTARRDVKRARIVLRAAEGRSTCSIAEEVGVQPRIVSHWRRRFAEHGLGGLKDRPRAGKKPIDGKAAHKRIPVLQEKPPPLWPGGWVRCWHGLGYRRPFQFFWTRQRAGRTSGGGQAIGARCPIAYTSAREVCR